VQAGQSDSTLFKKLYKTAKFSWDKCDK